MEEEPKPLLEENVVGLDEFFTLGESASLGKDVALNSGVVEEEGESDLLEIGLNSIAVGE